MVLKEKLEFLVSFDKLECGRKAFVLLIVDLFVVWVSHLLVVDSALLVCWAAGIFDKGCVFGGRG